jgi:hypothetical protein
MGPQTSSHKQDANPAATSCSDESVNVPESAQPSPYPLSQPKSFCGKPPYGREIDLGSGLR